MKAQVKAQIFKHKLMGRNLLLCVSGGIDSMVLLHLFNELAQQFQLKLAVLTVHHGFDKKNEQLAFRNKAVQLVMDECSKLNLPFITNDVEQIKLTSESDFRDYRYKIINKFKNEEDLVVLGHHRDDLLETRIIRLIRGVGPKGLESMQVLDSPMYRPLLNIAKKEINNYAIENDVTYLNDPSNNDNKHLRNWVRNYWLPQLEDHRPGSYKALNRSLENLVPIKKKSFDCIDSNGIDRSALLPLQKSEKRAIFAAYLRELNVSNYTASQIDEVIKRLDSTQKELIFRVMGCDWTVDTRHIHCSVDQ